MATDTITYQGTIENKYAYDKVSNRTGKTTKVTGNVDDYTEDVETGNRISKQVNEEEKVFYLNDTYTSLTQVALELTKNTDNTYKVNKYYTRGLELISADIQENVTEDATENTTNPYFHKIYIQDGHGSVTALVENSKITDTYTYDSYGIMLKKTGDTDNDYLYTGEQYNESTVFTI